MCVGIDLGVFSFCFFWLGACVFVCFYGPLRERLSGFQGLGKACFSTDRPAVLLDPEGPFSLDVFFFVFFLNLEV